MTALYKLLVWGRGAGPSRGASHCCISFWTFLYWIQGELKPLLAIFFFDLALETFINNTKSLLQHNQAEVAAKMFPRSAFSTSTETLQEIYKAAYKTQSKSSYFISLAKAIEMMPHAIN